MKGNNSLIPFYFLLIRSDTQTKCTRTKILKLSHNPNKQNQKQNHTITQHFDFHQPPKTPPPDLDKPKTSTLIDQRATVDEPEGSTSVKMADDK